jgi:hypothetical protein
MDPNLETGTRQGTSSEAPLHIPLNHGSRVRKWALIAGTALACSPLLTGGIYVNNQTHIHGNHPQNAPLTVQVLYDFRETHVPLLFHRGEFKSPYRLKLEILDPSKKYDRIEIDEMVLQYSDGETIRGMRNWSKDVRESDWMLRAFHGEVAMYGFSEILDLAAPRAEPFTFTTKGILRTNAGKSIPVNQKIDFQVNRATVIYSYWLKVLGHSLV